MTGNPLRPDLRAGTRADAVARFGLDPALPLVYVTGGAQGAHAINRAVGAIVGDLLGQAQVIHQCGDNRETGDFAWLQAQRAALPPALAGRYTVLPWIGAELAAIYAAASLVVSRAGAGHGQRVLPPRGAGALHPPARRQRRRADRQCPARRPSPVAARSCPRPS